MLIQVVAHSSQFLVSVIILSRPPVLLTDAIVDLLSGCKFLHPLSTLSPADQLVGPPSSSSHADRRHCPPVHSL
ncbi:hypothetical protein DEU56DRAFT_827888 [Suillus clintonianus]|uniref:uncharacterized protein n=1 Tax=Suillus clintonianus TaxID=1904413 RepID=UPI001B869E4A|nr:uncharacterized protein DEU56DRAFT_827888 [Suillus clintonianus]KAG2124165.1 hypothetical protein DEU56DRAFT_827888 [Suillus clintonianus]